MTPTTAAERQTFDDQDTFLEMRNGPHGAFAKALGEAALQADPSNRRKITLTWPDLFAECEAIVARRLELGHECFCKVHGRRAGQQVSDGELYLRCQIQSPCAEAAALRASGSVVSD